MSETLRDVRERAIKCFNAAVRAADPERATRAAIDVDGDTLRLRAGDGWRSGDWRRIHCVAFGKAACGMATALDRVIRLPSWHGPGLAVTYYENEREVPNFDVLGAGHPLPDERGVHAGRRVLELANALGEGDLLLVLISGGGSALLPLPAEDISLEEKIATTDLLLASGANIGELNTVRKHLSALKGGNLARAAAPAAVYALILSDVIGDDLSTIASGPTAPDPTTFADAMAILERHDIVGRVPASVRARFEKGVAGEIPDTPAPGDPLFERTGATLVGSNRISLEALRESLLEGCESVRTHSAALCGEARAEAHGLVEAAIAARRGRDVSNQRPLAIVAGGETTVTVTGDGKGGRNQELALAFALQASRAELSGDWVFLSGGTDGRDGPTDAAGGIVDAGSLGRMRAAGVDPRAALEKNDSYRALAASGDLLVTGVTGTNVADLQLCLVL